MALNTTEQEFHMEEYRQLRVEVASFLARIETLLRYSMVVSAAVYSWLIVQTVGFAEIDKHASTCFRLPRELLVYGLWIPPVFVVLAGLGAAVTRLRVGQTGQYLKELEDLMGLKSLGWEKFLEKKASIITGTTLAVWLLVFIATTVASLEVSCVIKRSSEIACPAKAT